VTLDAGSTVGVPAFSMAALMLTVLGFLPSLGLPLVLVSRNIAGSTLTSETS